MVTLTSTNVIGRPKYKLESVFYEHEAEIDGPTEKGVGTRCVTLAEPLDQNLACPLCKDVLKDPMQTPCGHRFCRSCLTPLLRNANPKCPVDGQNLDPATVFPDICCKRELLSLSCICPFKDRGCSWKGELRDFHKHCDECQYGDAQCSECGDSVQKRNLDEHKSNWCSYRLVKCDMCGEDIPQAQMEAHLDACPKVTVRCRVGCGMDVTRDKMETHVKEECPKAERFCVFRIQGCNFKGTKADLEDHCQKVAQQHLEMMNAFSSQCQTQNQQSQEKVASLETTNKQLIQQLAVQNETLAAIRQDMRTQQVKLDMLQKSWSEQKNLVREVQSSANAFPDVEVILPQIEEMMNSLRTHEEKLVAMEQEMRQSKAASYRNGDGDFGPSSLTSFRAGERRVERNEHQLNLHEIRLNEADLRLQILQATSYDGNFIWKIDNYSQRFQDAASGKTPSIYSAPFYVGRFGYKVCARLYPYGDGMGRGTHVSLFFVVMRGEYDALLPWPFRQKVTFRMIDQDHVEDTTDAFRPDASSASFRRPTSSMNIASGCPLFISHSTLRSRGYVKDNVMFIKVSVDINGLNTSF